MTKYEKMRMSEIERHTKNINHDDGAQGRIFEIECASKNSKKTRVSKQGETDIYIHIGTKNSNIKAECKTNGGRIESLINGTNKAKFIIYRMDYTIKHKASKTKPERIERRFVSPVVIPTEIFINALRRFNALKSTNGKNPEIAIQVSSKKFYEWLLDWPIPFEAETIYTIDDFDGLE